MLSSTISIEKLVESSPKIREAMGVIYSEVGRLTKNEKEAAQLFNAILKISPDRPKNWSVNSNACYYKKKYGDFLKLILTEFEKNYPKNSFLERKYLKARSVQSGLIMVTQAWLWIIEHDAEGEKYRALKDRVSIQRALGGLKLIWKDLPSVIELKELGEEVPGFEWKEQVIRFIEIAKDTEELVLERIILKPEQIKWLKNVLECSEGLFVKEISEIKLSLFMNKQLWRELKKIELVEKNS